MSPKGPQSATAASYAAGNQSVGSKGTASEAAAAAPTAKPKGDVSRH